VPSPLCARPIGELESAFAAGTRPVRFNPHADEVPQADRARDLGPWASLDASTRRRVLDSYRLAYQSTTTVNWCPKLGTVLANDEVIDGKSERGGYPVLRKPLKQWMFRITAYADRLIEQLDTLDWPSSTKAMQREWIGKSEGAEVEFAVLGTPTLRVFTTRPDTLFGATYMVVAPEHPLCASILAQQHSVSDETRAALQHYVAWARNRSDVERQESKEKTGAATGLFALNPVTGQQIPIWTSDYVMMGYGTGAIMAVPAHDERDFEFATRFGLPIVEVVQNPVVQNPVAQNPADGAAHTTRRECFAGEGVAINSSTSDGSLSLDGLTTSEAKQRIIAWLEAQGLGARRTNYKLRDWTFSRQRYWGEPFPIVYDDAGNAYPISASHLPVRLPELADYAPVESDDPQPLLAKATSWVRTTAGEAGVDPSLLAHDTPVTRETNTMPGSAGSSWYAIRYCDPHNTQHLVGKQAEQYWMGTAGTAVSPHGAGSTGVSPVPHRAPGVDLYLGGSEHAVGHLLYARFWQNVLFDLGYVACKEPFHKLFHQGLITSFAYQRADKSIVPVDEVREVSEGQYEEIATSKPVTPIITKMSKRYKNVVNPDDVIAQYGADTCRLYEMAMGPLEASKPWNPRDIVGCYRFLQRAWRLCVDEATGQVRTQDASASPLEKALHKLIKKVASDIESMGFNTAIAAMIEFVNLGTTSAASGTLLSRSQLERFMLVLQPFAPHLAQEVWHRAGNTTMIAHASWPAFDESMLVESEIELPVSINGKLRTRIMVPAHVAKEPKALETFALAHADVLVAIAAKPIKKVIAVPSKMVNIVL
jgi:leucyl-tRNA synthetase